MAADTAYKILKAIGAVALTLAVGYLLLQALKFLLGVSIATAFKVFGTGILGGTIACALMGCSFSSIMDMLTDWLENGLNAAGKIADTTYGALKRSAKSVYQYTGDNIIPAVENALSKAKQVICGIAAWIAQKVRSKAASLAKA